ncbi:MAG: GAF domain-containing protein [Syntrophorhabdaceae bacterium]|nr:GAF domain-containing protein [Syntrophorhabdaceae bacterium]
MMVNEIDELKAKLLEKEEELKILHEVADYISSNVELDELLQHIVDMIMEFVVADSCLIYLYNVGTDELILKASNEKKYLETGRVKIKMGEGVTGWVAKEKKPVALAEKAYKDPRFKTFAFLDDEKYEAFLSVPILSKEEIIGVMNIRNKKAHVYPEPQIKLLFTISRYLGSAIKHAIVNEEIVKKAKRLNLLSEVSRTIVSDYYLKEILQLIVTMTAKVMDSQICSIMLLDGKKEELVISATQSLSEAYRNKPNLKIGQSISGRAVKEKRPIVVLDVTKEPGYMFPDVAKKEGLVSLLSVPMMIKDRVIGVINSYTRTEHRFTEEEVDILQTVANQAAVAIENTRLDQEILAAKEALEARKMIEKAKGILMKELGISEDEAYKKINRKSMDLRKSMKDVAEAIILASELRKIT